MLSQSVGLWGMVVVVGGWGVFHADMHNTTLGFFVATVSKSEASRLHHRASLS